MDSRGAVQKTFTRSVTPKDLEGEAFQRLFYDPAKPARSVVLSTLPTRAAPDERGQISGCGVFRVIWVLIPPIAAVAFVAVGLVLKGTMK